VGFSVLGTELYNPVVRNFFSRTSIKNLPLALELSAESLPSFIANIPDFKSLLKNPVSIFYRVLSQADARLAEIKQKNISDPKVFIITGSVGEGKTTFTKKLIEYFRQNNIKPGGILSERVMTGSKTTGYDLVNIKTGEKETFLRQYEECGSEKIGKFNICPKGLAMGKVVLSSFLLSGNGIVVIDEVGSLELNSKGWAGCFDNLLNRSGNSILITVRDIYVDQVIKKWNLKETVIFNVGETDYLKAGKVITEKVLNCN
jgi:nucleoside-triphosphatase THEP1